MDGRDADGAGLVEDVGASSVDGEQDVAGLILAEQEGMERQTRPGKAGISAPMPPAIAISATRARGRRPRRRGPCRPGRSG